MSEGKEPKGDFVFIDKDLEISHELADRATEIFTREFNDFLKRSDRDMIKFMTEFLADHPDKLNMAICSGRMSFISHGLNMFSYRFGVEGIFLVKGCLKVLNSDNDSDQEKWVKTLFEEKIAHMREDFLKGLAARKKCE